MVTNTQYKTLMKEIREMREDLGRIDKDLATDREDLESFKVEMASMKEEIKQLRHALNYNANKVGQQVTDSLAPAVKEVSKLKEEIKKKKFVTLFRSNFLDWLKIKLGGEKHDN